MVKIRLIASLSDCILLNHQIFCICGSDVLSLRPGLYRTPQKTPQLPDMIIVQIKDNESVDRALKRFKKKFERTGVLKELRRRTFFQKPSITQRKMKQKAVYKLATYGQDNNE